MKKSLSDRVFTVSNTIFMLVVLFVMLYPLYFTLIASFSDPYEVVKGNISFLPKGMTLDAYRFVFKNKEIWTGYRNIIVYTALGTLLNLVLTIPTAYALSKRNLPGRMFLSWYFLFTMYFKGGLIPTYLIVRSLGLVDKPYTIIVLSGIEVFNIIVARVFFATTIPESIYEAARIDGSSEFRSFAVIALPLAAPIIAVVGLFYGVVRWNNYFNALIYLSDRDLFPLQLVLRGILIGSKNALIAITEQGNASDDVIRAAARLAYMAEAMKYSLIFIGSAPLLIAYPFIQKFFVKGIMIGSLKE